MTPDEFDRLIREKMSEKSAWFDGAEPPASEDAVRNVESNLGCALPSQYKHFALTFGGGYFGGINISTLDKASDWYLLARPAIKVDGKVMLIISDDEAGGYFGFISDNDSFEPSITYINPDDGNHRENAAPSFFDFICKFAMNL